MGGWVDHWAGGSLPLCFYTGIHTTSIRVDPYTYSGNELRAKETNVFTNFVRLGTESFNRLLRLDEPNIKKDNTI